MDQTYPTVNLAMPVGSPTERPNAIHAQMPPSIVHVERRLPPDQSPCPEEDQGTGLGNSESRDSIPGLQTAASMLPDPRNAAIVNMPTVDYGQMSDEQLLEQARSSDRHAFGELASRYANSILNRVFRIVRNRADAEDVVQETLVKAHAHFKDFRGTCRFSTWLTKIAINSALMLLRRRRTRSEVSFDPRGNEDRTWEMWDCPDPSPNPEQVYATCQARELLSRAITRLPPAYRSVMTQYHYQEQPLKDVADSLGISVASAKSRLLRARLTIRSALGEMIKASSKR